MDKLKLKAHAKINLYLDVLSKRSDGYHNVVTVLQSLELVDLVFLSPSQKLEVVCPGLEVLLENNLAYQAALLLQQEGCVKQGARIKIIKNIPVATGLGGGSADAAATLTGLNLLWDLGLPLETLQVIGAEVGADVPFCLQGGTMLAEGKGEKLKVLTPLPDVAAVLAIPPFKISTKEAYEGLDTMGLAPLGTSQAIIKALSEMDLTKVAASLANIFEQIVAEEHPKIIELKSKAMKAGSLGALMSGSGGAVFALVSDTQQSGKVTSELKALGAQTILTRSFSQGVEVLKE